MDVTVNRERGIGGSDCYDLMITGNWKRLYDKKVNAIEEDLSDNFRVQLGVWTEDFNMQWLMKKLRSEKKQTNKGVHIFEVEANHILNSTDWRDLKKEKFIDLDEKNKLCLYAHLDGYIPSKKCIIECKHTSELKTLSDLIESYNPQMQHYMNVFDCDRCIISGIFGNKDHKFQVIERDDAFIERLVEMQKAFWGYVINKIPPEIND